MDRPPTVTAVPLPQGSLIAGALPQTHYSDAFRMALPPSAPQEIDALVRAVFATAPGWVSGLLRLRNALVRPFGINTSPPTAGAPAAALQPGAVVGIFRVFARNNDEIIMGDDDRHLNFRVGVLRETGAAPAVTVSTTVQFHNWLGRAYFVPVRPFHRLIVPSMMRSGAAHLARQGAAAKQ